MPPAEGDDVVGLEEDEPGAPAAPPTWVKRAAVVLVAGLAVFGLSRAGLLSSADEPPPGGRPSGSPSGSSVATTSEGPRLVARLGGRLLLAAYGGPEEGARLPDGLPADAVLVPVRPGNADPDGLTPGPVVGVHDGALFRADADRPRFRDLGPAEAMVAAGLAPSRALVVRAGDLDEVEVAAGETTDQDPYPGFVPDRWTPLGVVAAVDSDPLLMRRDTGQARGGLAVAWPREEVQSGARSPVTQLGEHGQFLGISNDVAVSLLPGCPGPACVLDVLRFTRDRPSSRTVAPPRGWTFIAGPLAGRSQTVVPVERLTAGKPDGTTALARLIPGGVSALLVAGSQGVRLSAGLADGPGGSVYFLTDPVHGGDPRARVWDPDQGSAGILRPAATFPQDARLVCVCG